MKYHQIVHYKRLASLEEKLKPAILYTGATSRLLTEKGQRQ